MTTSRRCDGGLGSEMDETLPCEGLDGCGKWKGIRTPRTKKPISGSVEKLLGSDVRSVRSNAHTPTWFPE